MAQPNIAEAERRIREAAEAGAEVLDLRWLDLTELPLSLAGLTHLRELQLGHNCLTAIPDWLTHLHHMEVLNVEDNWLTHLPGPFEKLCVLGATHNRVLAIASSITGCTKLQDVFLGHNHLKEVPDSIAQLDRLEVLNLAGNDLTQLPDAMGRLGRLVGLNLVGNRLTDLPDSLGRTKRLSSLTLDGNPFTGELAEVAKRGTPAVLEFLRARAISTRQWRAKLMLVGEGLVGKTNLLRRLKGESFIANNDPTNNLEIRQLGIAHPSQAGVTIDLRAWDFGGQYFMHATHQFFYSGKSIFLMVWNARDNFEQSKLPHWLDRIQALAPDSPVLLVATHGEKFRPNIPLQEIKARYPNVRELHVVDTADPAQGINELRAAILELALGLDHMGQRRPASWTKASEMTRAYPEPYLETPSSSSRRASPIPPITQSS
jgi:GTPase SAR1 family protein